jgi:uncharacterized protein (TIGR04255 family)
VKLSKPPLKYVLAQVRFSSIENIASMLPLLQDKIRADFPIQERVDINSIRLKEGRAPDVDIFTQWHFVDKERKTGIILDKQTLTIHTSKHVQFEQLLGTFAKVASLFHEILKFSLFTRLGLRYVNLIEDDVSKIDKGLQGFKLSGNEFKKNSYITKTETIQRSIAGMMKVQAIKIEDVKNISGVQNIFVSPDLGDVAKLLSFEHYKKPKKKFVILDIDHFNDYRNDFKVEEIIQLFHTLHDPIYQAFRQAVGLENLNSWK